MKNMKFGSYGKAKHTVVLYEDPILSICIYSIFKHFIAHSDFINFY